MVEHDQGYKLLFSHKELVEDLIRGFIREPWVEELDLSSLERISGSYVSDDLRERLDDMVWRARWEDRDLYIYILLEFQSEPDGLMALRMMVYVGLLLQDLAKRLRLEVGSRLPPVLPLVLYNGEQPWTAPRNVAELIVEVPGLDRYQPRLEYLLIDESRYGAEQLEPLRNLAAALFRMEQSREPQELGRVLGSLADWLPGPEHRGLRRAFLTWVTRVLLPAKLPEAAVPRMDDLREFQTMLEQRVQEWTREWMRQGLEEGRKMGLEKGLEKGLEEGLEKGLEEGRREGEAILLLQQAAWKFGSVPPEIENRIQTASPQQLLIWAKLLLTAERLDDLFV